MSVFDETSIAILITIAVALISLGVDMVRSGQVWEGLAVIVVGLVIILVYYIVVQPSYFKKRFGVYVQTC